ncbi:MAG: response regulator [Bacteroidia bacterium]
MKKVLLIDDDKINNFLASLVIKQTKLALVIKECLNGQEAIDYLTSARVETLPDIILLDINMPVLDGWQFLDFLTQSSVVKDVPVFVFSSSNYDLDIVRAKEYPIVKGYIIKPLKKEMFINLVENL